MTCAAYELSTGGGFVVVTAGAAGRLVVTMGAGVVVVGTAVVVGADGVGGGLIVAAGVVVNCIDVAEGTLSILIGSLE